MCSRRTCNMSWRQISPAHWQRLVGENERMIKWIGERGHPMGREQWSITAVATFAFSRHLDDDVSFSRLGRAWAILRFTHPSIAATASTNTLDYRVPDLAMLHDWIGDTLHVISDLDANASDLIAALKPSPNVNGYFLPHAEQFIIHIAHWRTDGFGALQLLNAFFEALAADLDPATTVWGEEPARLSPCIEEVLELPVEPTDEIRVATAECLATVTHVAGSVGLPYRGDNTTKPAGTRGARRSLSVAASASILAACEARGLKPLSAVHASLAATNFKFASGGSSASEPVGKRHYTSTMRFSLRPYLRAPFNTAQHASALYTGGYFAAVEADASWRENAEQYDGLYSASLSRRFLLARRQYATQALDGMIRSAGSGGPVRSEIDISSVDDAEKLVVPVHHCRNTDRDEGALELEVKDISLGVECLVRETYLFFWIYRGKIEFNLVYNEAFYDASYMETILDALENSLKSELLGND